MRTQCLTIYGENESPDDQFYRTVYPKITFKKFEGVEDKPLRIMRRQHLPSWHEDRISYEERMYRFFRDYRIDMERGRIAASTETYSLVNQHESYYKALSNGEAEIFNGWTGRVSVLITPENRGAYHTYMFSKDTARHKAAWLTLMGYLKYEGDYVYLPYATEVGA